jgi:signal transduction histidine kinase
MDFRKRLSILVYAFIFFELVFDLMTFADSPIASSIQFIIITTMVFWGYFSTLEFLKTQKEKFEHIVAELEHKNTYLEHAAKILRHDMHSGINTYIPRGISSLERRLNPEVMANLKLEAPLKLLKDGLLHTQRVYRGVTEFTNLVKQGQKIEKQELDIRKALVDYLDQTSYKDQVAIDWLPTIPINEPLFCTAIDNLIRNGLKYNDSEFKMVAIFMVDDYHMAIQDNGRGMTSEEFQQLSKPYTRKEGQKEKGTGLGLNICIAILTEHGFAVSCEKQEEGTRVKVKIR